MLFTVARGEEHDDHADRVFCRGSENEKPVKGGGETVRAEWGSS